MAQQTVAKGAQAVRAALQAVSKDGPVMVVADAISNQDLRILGEAMADEALLTGGSGIALGLPDNFRRAGLLAAGKTAAAFTAPHGPAVILSGSCSAATNGQVAYAQAQGVPSLGLDPLAIADQTQTVATVLDPRLKLEFYSENGNNQVSVVSVKEVVNYLYQRYLP